MERTTTDNSTRLLNLIWIFVGLKLLMHLAAIWLEGYGVFRDELYYFACADHLATGYVDQPPLSIWILSAFTAIFGDHWQVVRIIPAVFGGLTMLVLLKWVRLLGGSLLAIAVAGTAFMFAPINIGFASVFSMNSIDLFFWSVCFYQITKTLRKPENTWHWITLGIFVGLGMMNKISISWFAIGLIVYLITTPQRKLLLSQGPYVAGIIALIIFIPFIIWNISHDMAHIEFAKNASRFKYAGITRADFLQGIILLENPLSLVLLIASFFFFLNRKYSFPDRAAIIIFFTTFLILIIKGQVKSEYLAGAYLAVFATGSVQLAEIQKPIIRKAVIISLLTAYFLFGSLMVPLALPILEEEHFIRYNKWLGIDNRNNEGKEESELPQFYADMHGWEELAKNVSDAWMSLPETERSHAVVWANNYGEAGAIDYYRDKYPLPPVLSRHNNYYLWGQEYIKKSDIKTFIILGGSEETHKKSLRDVTLFTIHTCQYCMPYENDMPVFIGSDPDPSLELLELFSSDRNYN
ncbi:glycosyltransferase family 39 protein [Fulvivirga sedimenti]|uniref:Glycosyltransferase family 39 protein n=1 Tax=Fulvivirga sedimenti TaxID=2879465 RepID=A0A9X1HQD0_9BACT|nr:glycosyltransferase family 39 protein [Fulvivirga sedimenti]MCA6074302.1 glycosyltransferase family 39 protein [Fulvivirga sedimenti]